LDGYKKLVAKRNDEIELLKKALLEATQDGK
jgi:hypothetical protein